MRPWNEIKENTQLQVTASFVNTAGETTGFQGYLNLREFKKTMIVIASVDNDGKRLWEHVSVSYHGETKKLPTWTEMCAVKDIFWGPEEEVHQIHPKESEYVHGFRGKDNILHLWRPVGGWELEG